MVEINITPHLPFRGFIKGLTEASVYLNVSCVIAMVT